MTATLLPDGRVLVVGGDASSTATTAELYDPATNSWSLTAGFTPRIIGFSAVLLQDGQVLVASGAISAPPFYTPQAELYDPTCGTWTRTGNVLTARSDYSATLLSNGKVLVAGGNGRDNTLSPCELYDPVTGTWTQTGSLQKHRQSHRATLLPDGRVLVAGGGVNALRMGFVHVAEIYDVARGVWHGAGKPLLATSDQAQNLLPDGSVLVAGGVSEGPGSPTSREAQIAVPMTGE